MLLTAILPWKKRARENAAYGEALAIEKREEEGDTVLFEMDLHVPCRVVGITKDGFSWKGETSTLSISSFGAHLLLPPDVELEGDITLSFKVPPPLASLFPKIKFRAKAEIKPSGAAEPGMSSKGKRVVYIVFAAPLHFNLKGATSRA
jgi:hypothetical protein